MPEIFVNYRTGDCEETAVAIEQGLSTRFGSERIFRASKSIRPGENYQTRLATASAAARALLVLIGPGWLDARDENGNPKLADENDWTRKEILNARESGARIIPILCGRKTDRLSAAKLPAELRFLADLQSIVYDTGSAEADMDKIAAHLAELVPGLDFRKTPRSRAENSITGTNSGNAVQTQEMNNGTITFNSTEFHGSTGPVSTGSGNLNIFHGDGTNYVQGDNLGGIHQNFGAKRKRKDR
ncbi:TIR domain-containing protein [Saccharopolyspora kobensis]|uniref:TIR domain-containing protein n=1 Tax=Saccharopolyspora kobensis TaxID=146035 RepID=A0A1H6DRW7_9PSEU|nr:TIR domain-containing protein [Saccharopolyspora kobensis]SEG87978.1 TIR domain-containing protein [Saccharopolyspora kobensis]SFE03904.1 TIR domain-containing protein [Saccharopolyspora kobensis]